MIGATVVPVGAFPLLGYLCDEGISRIPGTVELQPKRDCNVEIRFSPASGVRMTRLAK
jgi:hypothetical protein